MNWKGASRIQSVWFKTKGKGVRARTRAQADAWLKAHKMEPSIKSEKSKEGHLIVRLSDPAGADCFRFGPWVGSGGKTVRFLYAGDLPGRAKAKPAARRYTAKAMSDRFKTTRGGKCWDRQDKKYVSAGRCG